MRIKEILNQNRRDFTAIYVCDHCGVEETKSGYDDENFHQNVIPDMKCKSCGNKAKESYRPLKPKYDQFQVV